jgi:methionyl-tRNA synthetase
MTDCVPGEDGAISYSRMEQVYNADLANNIGNLLSRVATVVGKKCDGVGPAPQDGSPLQAVATEVYAATADAWGRIAPHEALDATWRLIHETNAYLEENEPWKADPGAAVDAVMGDALEALRIVSVLAWPAMPSTVQTIWERIGLTGSVAEQRLPDAARWGGYPGGLAVEKGPPVFPRFKA